MCGGTTCTNSNGVLKEKLAPESARRNINRYINIKYFPKKVFRKVSQCERDRQKCSDKFLCWSNLQNSFACQSGHKGNHENSNDNAKRKEVKAALARGTCTTEGVESRRCPQRWSSRMSLHRVHINHTRQMRTLLLAYWVRIGHKRQQETRKDTQLILPAGILHTAFSFHLAFPRRCLGTAKGRGRSSTASWRARKSQGCRPRLESVLSSTTVRMQVRLGLSGANHRARLMVLVLLASLATKCNRTEPFTASRRRSQY